MLVDRHGFLYTASIPWPHGSRVNAWQEGVHLIDTWLNSHVGVRLCHWAWTDSGSSYQIGVAFKWDCDRLLFLMTWS